MTPNHSHPILTWLYERHYGLLVACTLTYIGVAPFADAAPWVFWLLEALVLVLMFMALLTVWGMRSVFIAGVNAPGVGRPTTIKSKMRPR